MTTSGAMRTSWRSASSRWRTLSASAWLGGCVFFFLPCFLYFFFLLFFLFHARTGGFLIVIVVMIIFVVWSGCLFVTCWCQRRRSLALILSFLAASRRYFFSAALALKLGMFMDGRAITFALQPHYEEL